MTLRGACAGLLCAAGIVMGLASWNHLLGWTWGLFAVLVFLYGWHLLRKDQPERTWDGEGAELLDTIDLLDGDIDIVDCDIDMFD